MPEDNCNEITTMFSFYTWNDPGDHRQLIDKHIPVKLNGIETTAEVLTILPANDGLKYALVIAQPIYNPANNKPGNIAAANNLKGES